MSRTEKETRIELIDPKLRLAGWIVLSDKHIIEKGKACIETAVVGMPKTIENSSGNGFVDYVLFGDDGKPLALIEAKKSIANEEQGRAQASLYADCLEKQYGLRPVVYYTNGYSIKMIDGIIKAPRTVFGFHRKDELEYIIEKRERKIDDRKVDENICGRYYQKDAIGEVLKHLDNHSRSLIVLATGTGKTRVSCALSDIFIRNNYVKRILFLADRKNLVIQAKQKTFEKFLPKTTMAMILDGKKEGDESKARIVFSTYQSMISIIRDVKKCPYGIGHFDLIIVDEAHRSLFNKYGEIFSYFDAVMIGLTATPRSDVHKSTYRVFDLDKESPNYEYDVVRGVKDGFLTYYRALDRTPKILKEGLTYDNLSEEEKEQYEETFTDDDGTLPEYIEGEKFYSAITNRDTIREVLKDLMNEGLKVNNGDELGKTIIFARDHNHALMIQEEFRSLYKDKCYKNNPNGIDYCVVIDNKIKYNEILQSEFSDKQSIRIVISVDMMDTGVDIPEVVNLVFFKKILSKIKFWQMIGRGTRVCENLNVISPSKSYFERLTNDKTRQLYKDKQGFLIFDICNVFPFFKQHKDGREDKSDDALSLYQKIYVQKVYLYKNMQYNYSKLAEVDRKFINNLREDLILEIKKLNRNYIGVQKNLKFIEKYEKASSWMDFKQEQFVEVKKYIAPNIIGEIDLPAARAFDYLCYKFAATKYLKNKDFEKVSKTIYTLALYLIKTKNHIEEVKAHHQTLVALTSNSFIEDTLVSKVDEYRKEVRDLMRYIEKKDLDPIITDFSDEIESTADAVEEEVDFNVTVDDFKTFEEKVLFYINKNLENPFVKSIQNLTKPEESDFKSFKSEIVKLANDTEEYNKLFSIDKDLEIFVRKNIEINPEAIEMFVEKQKKASYNEIQIDYIKELLEYVFQNGKFDKQDLLKPELNFNGIFNNIEINKLILAFEECFK